VTIQQIFAAIGPGSVLASILGGAYSVGFALESNISAAARSDFSKYLLAGQVYSDTLQIPKGIRSCFERIFAKSHFSWKCLRRSTATTIVSILALILIFGFHNPRAFKILNDFIIHQDDFLIGNRGRIFLALWLLWSVTLDYIMLFKTRLLLKWFEKQTSQWALLYATLLLLDFTIGYAAFAFGTAFLVDLIEYHGNVLLASQEALASASSYRTFSDLFSSGAGETGGVFLALFTASILPSLWFWLWVLATLSGKLAGALLPVFRFSGYVLPVSEKPFQATSITAGILGCTVYGGARIIFG
jgi:hypothetical protein